MNLNQLKIGLLWTVFILLSCACFSKAEAEAEDKKDVCCQTIFLFATGAVGEHQSALMGRYNFTDMHNGKPYFTKMFNNKTYYFYYQTEDKPTGPGWIVGSDLEGLALNIVTPGSKKKEPQDVKFDDISCPVGIQGAYDRNETMDESFIVECEDMAAMEVGPKCCSVISVSARKSISEFHIVRLGIYNKTGVYNGHPLYHLNQYDHDSYLYFRKKGRIADGWTIGTEPDQESFSITTRNRTDCPNQATTGFDRDKETDITFRIICESDDGEVPDALEKLEDEVDEALLGDLEFEIVDQHIDINEEKKSENLSERIDDVDAAHEAGLTGERSSGTRWTSLERSVTIAIISAIFLLTCQ